MSDYDLIRRRDVIAIMYDWAERPSEMPHAALAQNGGE
jgi:hypothetical protein